MTEKEITEIARKKADYWMNHYDRKSLSDMSLLYKDIEAFAKLIAEKEREECAKVCDELSKKYFWDDGYSVDCAESIRARGQE